MVAQNKKSAFERLKPDGIDRTGFTLSQENEGNRSLSSASDAKGGRDVEDNDQPAVPKPCLRTTTPDLVDRARGAAISMGKYCEDVYPIGENTERSSFKMHKFSLYETASRYYVVGVDVSEKRYRILKIDRTTEGAELNMTDDKIVYTLKEMNQLLDTIDDGNRGTGGIKLRSTTWGLLGFIKFTGPKYMLLITKKSTVALIGGHYVYQIEGTELIPLTPLRSKLDARNGPEEQRFLAMFNNLDLTKSFYYSYSYDITQTLQHNIIRERNNLGREDSPLKENFNSMFVWNSSLLESVVKSLQDPYDWCRPIIHGYIDQAGKSSFGL